MIYEIMKFEILYRIKKMETYIFFCGLFLFSLIAIDFFSQGVELGSLKKNSPILIAETMSILSGLLMLITSIVMGTAIIREFEVRMDSLMFINPISKKEYFFGRFLGAFAILVFIFSGMVFGMAVSEFMPWQNESELLSFHFYRYFQPFLIIVLPALFFGGAIFFVTAALSRKLIIVYTQGMCFFILFLLAKSVDNVGIGAILDPFSLISLGSVKQLWPTNELVTLSLPLEGTLLYNRLFWMSVGCVSLLVGYKQFRFTAVKERTKNKVEFKEYTHHTLTSNVPKVSFHFGLKSTVSQLFYQSFFYLKSMVKDTSFWIILLLSSVIIFVNGISLDISAGVLPKSSMVIEDLIENSAFLFFIVFIYYSADFIWKERDIRFHLISDSLPTHNFINLCSKFLGLIYCYLCLCVTLILSGIMFQALNGYYVFELDVYFKSFFIWLLPSLALFTMIAFCILVFVNNKFIGQFTVLLFLILIVTLPFLGIKNGLLVFGAGTLFSSTEVSVESNPLWYACYWFFFSVWLFISTSLCVVRDADTQILNRYLLVKRTFNKTYRNSIVISMFLFICIGIYLA